MKKITLFLLALTSCLGLKAEDGHQLWLRFDKVQKAQVSGPECLAAEELRNYYQGEKVTLLTDATMADRKSTRLNSSH